MCFFTQLKKYLSCILKYNNNINKVVDDSLELTYDRNTYILLISTFFLFLMSFMWFFFAFISKL